MSWLINLELTEPNPAEKEGYEYGYAMFEHLPDVYVNSRKHEPVPCVGISNVDATNNTVT